MTKICVNKEDLNAILTFREGTQTYERAADRLYEAMNGQNMMTIKWWILTHKRHYSPVEHIVEVPDHYTDLQIQYTIKELFDTIYHEIKHESGFRWAKVED